MAERFTTVVGAAAPLLRDNIDTDTIAPGSGPLKGKQAFVEKGSLTLADELFANWRYDSAGQALPDFVLNRPQFREARFLLAGANFGCGSSRESAVWMLKEWGIRCVVAPSFGEIFYNSCFKNGVLPVVLPAKTVAQLAEEALPGAPAALFTVDLANALLTTPSGRAVPFGVPALRRRGLLEGLDDIELTLQRQAEIDAFLQAARRTSPWAYPKHMG